MKTFVAPGAPGLLQPGEPRTGRILGQSDSVDGPQVLADPVQYFSGSIRPTAMGVRLPASRK